jgi:glutathione S-transferase
MTPTITAFEASPDRGRGLARDMRVRWALEEVGQAYDVRLLSFAELKQPAHRKVQPFGQIPTYEEGDLVLFESGAILLHLGERHGVLLPQDAHARLRAISWMFAAINTIEPPVFERSMMQVLERKEPWFEARAAQVDQRVRQRLGDLSHHLGESEWLDGDFSAGDLMMATVLMRAEALGFVDEFPNLAAYLARAKARPAFQRAFEAQRAVFAAAQARGQA